jgi:acyl-CoA thioester hydrolase
MKRMMENLLSARTKISVRFSEVDALRIVWHGNYVKYFEDGREAFGAKYGISYLDVMDSGYVTPVVKMSMEFKKPLEYSDSATVETRFINTEAAKIVLDYTIYRESDNEVVATGNSVQVFLDKNGNLMLTNPDFYLKWKQKLGLI